MSVSDSSLLLFVAHADVAQLVEHHLAKVRVASSNLVIRSKKHQVSGPIRAAGLRFRLVGIPSRTPDTADARAVLVSLTDAGRNVADRLAHARARRFDDLLASIPDNRHAVVIESVRCLADAARSATRGMPS